MGKKKPMVTSNRYVHIFKIVITIVLLYLLYCITLSYIISWILSMQVSNTEQETEMIQLNSDNSSTCSCQTISPPHLVRISIDTVHMIHSWLQSTMSHDSWFINKTLLASAAYVIKCWICLQSCGNICSLWCEVVRKWQFQHQSLLTGNSDCEEEYQAISSSNTHNHLHPKAPKIVYCHASVL